MTTTMTPRALEDLYRVLRDYHDTDPSRSLRRRATRNTKPFNLMLLRALIKAAGTEDPAQLRAYLDHHGAAPRPEDGYSNITIALSPSQRALMEKAMGDRRRHPEHLSRGKIAQSCLAVAVQAMRTKNIPDADIAHRLAARRFQPTSKKDHDPLLVRVSGRFLDTLDEVRNAPNPTVSATRVLAGAVETVMSSPALQQADPDRLYGMFDKMYHDHAHAHADAEPTSAAGNLPHVRSCHAHERMHVAKSDD